METNVEIQTGTESPADYAPDSSAPETVESLPRQFAPLIRNAWYVIAHRRDVGRSLRSIEVLNEKLVYYRTEAGTPTVLDDRCPHRMYPLSNSHLIEDSIQCGYHGFTYNSQGRCTYVPGVERVPNFGVRRYPAVERGPYLWVWMGDEGAADPAEIPLVNHEYDASHYFDGYMLNECNYMLVIDNLLDLTHIHFLHGPMLADRASVELPLVPLVVPGGVGTRKIIASTSMGALGTCGGDDPQRMVRRSEENRALGPSLVDATLFHEAVDGINTPIRAHTIRILHAITPSGIHKAHQFFTFAFSDTLAVPPEEARDMLVTHFFKQDLNAVKWQMEAILRDKRQRVIERRMPADRPSVEMLRILKQRAAGESRASTTLR